MKKQIYDIIVIGAGHAGVEAALACARLKKKTLMLTVDVNNIAFLACNPSIGGTAKGQIASEVDALGGEMGKAA
ncbi:MAG: FAD-dependent oxidoreductase, partial [Firmicutes bacterium]|nr:FAD-dependent oxidoreductase [Bacillota bacterium]